MEASSDTIESSTWEGMLCTHCAAHFGMSCSRTVNGCLVCMGAYSFKRESLTTIIDEKCQPYGGTSQQFSYPPTVAISGQVYVMYVLIALERNYSLKEAMEQAHDYVKDIKQSLKDLIVNHLGEFLIEDSEEGTLGLHLVLQPPCQLEMPISKTKKRKRRRLQSEVQQGGNPRVNLQESLGFWTVSEAQDYITKKRTALQDWFQQWNPKPLTSTIHVAVWRHSIYIKGCYTKARRDVSQTPFFVVEQGQTRQLSVTSVQEQVSPPLEAACGGIATSNNTAANNNVMFGMLKFHASGREDMNVRMLLPLDTTTTKMITGRPFCCQVVDAHCIPSTKDLTKAMDQINHTNDSNNDASNCRRYGCNPMGVDVSQLELTHASYYKNLQSETESKVKHYECRVWTATDISQDVLDSLNGPYELQQATPIRVLHRRSLMVRQRTVIHCEATYDKPRWFILQLSTSAGTYVKEFVHGDLGRTKPSISSLLGCKTDIVDLDCTGIEM